MPMPTTRRGRFLLYKLRQRNRLRRVYQYKDKLYNNQYRVMPITTNRWRDWGGHTRQMPRVYPRHFADKSMSEDEWTALGWTAPEVGQWGVVRAGPGMGNTMGWRFAANGAYVGYHDRRILSIPRLKHLPWMPYRSAVKPTGPGTSYPFFRYPSGAVSWAGQNGWSVDTGP